jgi:chromosomal replication initiation ATPase DnaA
MMDFVLVAEGKRWKLCRRGSDHSPKQRAVRIAAHALGISLAVLRGSARSAYIVRRRRVVMLVLKDLGVGVTATGKLLARDHTTIWYGVGRAQLALRTDPEFRRLYERTKAVVVAKLGEAA